MLWWARGRVGGKAINGESDQAIHEESLLEAVGAWLTATGSS
jgi:hypothetical protein